MSEEHEHVTYSTLPNEEVVEAGDSRLIIRQSWCDRLRTLCHWRLLLLTCVVSLSSALQVYHSSVVNNVYAAARPFMLQTLGDDNAAGNVTKEQLVDQWSFMVTAHPIGTVAGLVLTSFIGDRLGRKPLTILSFLLCILGDGITLFARPTLQFHLLSLGRLIAGVGMGIALNSSVMFIAETSPLRLRGRFISVLLIFFGVGDMGGLVMGLDAMMGTDELWISATCATSVLIILALPVLLFLPESPHYLYLVSNDRPKALRSARFYQTNVEAMETMDLLQIEKEHNELQKAKSSFALWQLLTIKEQRSALFLAATLKAFVKFTGIQIVIQYSTSIFVSAGLAEEHAEWASVGLGFVKLTSSFLMPPLVDRISRKHMIVGSSVISALCNLAIAVAFLTSYEDSTVLGIASVSALMLYMSVFSALGGAIMALTAELFTQNTLSQSLSVTNVIGWFVAALTSFAYLPLVNWAGTWPVHAAMALLICVPLPYYWVCMPETRAISPVHVQQAMSAKKSYVCRSPGFVHE